MAAEEILCPICGQPLLGRDRFEGKCAACREKEVLGGPPARGGLEATDGATVECPECCAANPPGLAFCDQCGARLRPRRRRILAAALLALAAGALAIAYVATRGPAPARSPRGEAQAPAEAPGEPPAAAAPAEPGPPAPLPGPSALAPQACVETEALLSFLAARDYDRVIDNYCQPDRAEFERIERALDGVLAGGDGSGFSRWSAVLLRIGSEAAAERLRLAADPHPDYTAALLSHICRTPEASGSHLAAEDRAREVLRWHIAGLYEGLDLGQAKVGTVENLGQEGLVARVECPGQSTAPRPGDDPRRVHWRKLPVGWVVRFALAERLESIRETLRKPVPPAPAGGR